MALVYTTKEAVLAAVETALKTVSWISDVDRQQMGVGDYESPKGCFVADVRESRRYALKDCIVVEYFVLLNVHVYEPENKELSTLLNSAVEDVKTALQTAFTLGGIVDKVIADSVDTSGSFEAPVAYATVALSVSFLGVK